MATILIAEDNIPNQRLLSYRLRKIGHHVITASNGTEALEQLQISEPQLAILDIGMPGMNGLNLLEKIRSDLRYQSLPVIMLTASALEQHFEDSKQLGADGYLQKPVSSWELLNAVNSFLQPDV